MRWLDAVASSPAWALLVGLTFAACSEPGAGACRLNSDCPISETCYNGRCMSECREDRDCTGANVCDDGRCTPAEPMERLCSAPTDCRLSETCRAGICVAVSIMLPPADAGTSAPRDATPAPGQDASTQPGADASATDAAAPELLPYGAVCTRASECRSNLCLGPQGAASGRCTQSCQSDPDCFYPDRCVDVPGAGRFCGPTTSGKATGEACPNGPNECATGLCVTVSSGPICTQQCAPLPVCPVGLACAPVADGTGGAVAVCTPGNGVGFGASCARASDCASALCLGVGGTTGVCTSLCAQVPCPTGYTCTGVDNGMGGTVPICAPSGAVGGGFGATCTGASECSSGLCLSDARTGSAFCTIACTSPLDCISVSGLTCVTLATGERVCAPP